MARLSGLEVFSYIFVARVTTSFISKKMYIHKVNLQYNVIEIRQDVCFKIYNNI